MNITSLLFFLSMIVCYATFAWSSLSFFNEKREGYNTIYLLLKITSLFFWSYSIYLALTTKSRVEILYTLGFLCHVVSLTLFFWASKTIKNFQFSAIYGKDIPNNLITDGPYKYIRNPFYSSYLLCYLCTAIALQSISLGLTFLVLLSLYTLAIRLEENKFIWSDDLSEFSSYKKRTGKLVPKISFHKNFPKKQDSNHERNSG